MGFQCRRIPFLSTMAPPSILRDNEDGSERYNISNLPFKILVYLHKLVLSILNYLINRFLYEKIAVTWVKVMLTSIGKDLVLV